MEGNQITTALINKLVTTENMQRLWLKTNAQHSADYKDNFLINREQILIKLGIELDMIEDPELYILYTQYALNRVSSCISQLYYVLNDNGILFVRVKPTDEMKDQYGELTVYGRTKDKYVKKLHVQQERDKAEKALKRAEEKYILTQKDDWLDFGLESKGPPNFNQPDLFDKH